MHSSTTLLLLATATVNAIGIRDDCKDVHIFLAKGNNEPYPGRQGKLAGAICSGLKSCDYEDIQFQNALEDPFCDSVTEGVKNGIKQITAYNKKCPDSKLVVSGYSQGGQVVGDILGGGGGVFFQNCVEPDLQGLNPKTLPGSKIVAAMVFGDTRHTKDQPFNVLSGAGKNGLFPRPAGMLQNLASYGDDAETESTTEAASTTKDASKDSTTKDTTTTAASTTADSSSTTDASSAEGRATAGEASSGAAAPSSTDNAATSKEWSLPDPPLTEKGEEQCAHLRENLISTFSDKADNIDDVAIVVSPMRRTMQTAMLSLGWLVERGVKIEGNADWQENSSKPCDTGSPISSVSPSFPKVNFSSVDPLWPDKTSPSAERYWYTKKSILARGQRALEDLKKRPEKLIFVVSHAGFLRLGVAGYWFFNSDYRVFDFDGQGIKQQEGTLAGGMGLSLTEPVELGLDLPEEDPGYDAEVKE
ncbi:hypothetical protein ACJA88_011618 [Fusarium oxysporum]